MQLQEYEIEIVHVAGGKKHFADALSQNPAGLIQEQIYTLLVATINLNFDQSIKHDLGKLAVLQKQDRRLLEIYQKLTTGDVRLNSRFRLHND